MRGLNTYAKLATGSIVATSNYSTDGTTDLAVESHLLLHSLSSHYMIITSTGTTINKSQNICNNIFHTLMLISTSPSLIVMISTKRLIQNPCYRPPQKYHRHLQHGLGQHLQHDDRDAGFPSEIQGLLKRLQSNKNTCFFFLIGSKSPASLASIPSHPFHPSCTRHHSSVKSQTVSLPVMSIPTHVLTLSRKYYRQKSGNLLHQCYHPPRSSLFLVYLRVLLAITPPPSSLVRH